MMVTNANDAPTQKYPEIAWQRKLGQVLLRLGLIPIWLMMTGIAVLEWSLLYKRLPELSASIHFLWSVLVFPVRLVVQVVLTCLTIDFTVWLASGQYSNVTQRLWQNGDLIRKIFATQESTPRTK
ncbi:MAG: hypothetical protein KDA87_17130 [Planctomycetales bacterium]|nr:hypothetical protein [Planctomycetales bacterium]